MVSTEEKIIELKKLLKTLWEPMYANLSLLAVRITTDMFNGSGAILCVDESTSRMFVLTAKHNLWIAAAGPGLVTEKNRNPETLEEKEGAIRKWFTENAVLRYMALVPDEEEKTGKQNWSKKKSKEVEEKKPKLAEAVAESFEIHFPDETGFTYDACCFVVNYNPKKPPAAQAFPYFEMSVWLKPLLKLTSDIDQGSFKPKNQGFVQVGFGNEAQISSKSKQEPKSGTLQMKISSLEGSSATSYYNAATAKSDNVLLLESSEHWTTLPGDSGGPLFVVQPGKGPPLQVGVTLGSDYFSSKEEDESAEEDPDGKHNNAVTSLGPLYKWFADAKF